MARITPSSASGIDFTTLEDHEPYPVSISKFALEFGSDRFGPPERQLVVDFDLGDGETIRDWISMRLGKQQNGTPAKLRQLLNALSDKPADAEVAWFDDETLEWSYDGDTPFGRLGEGLELKIRGIHKTKEDGTPTFRITVYQSAKKRVPVGAGAGNGTPGDRLRKRATERDEEPPF